MLGLVHDDVSGLIALNYLLLAALTVFGASLKSRHADENNDTWVWDTISEMITRDDRLKHGFVLFVLVSVICVFLAIWLLMRRTKRINEFYHRHTTDAENFAMHAAWLCYAIAGLTLLGVGIVSTDTDQNVHTMLASIAFVSLLLTTLFLAVCMHSGHLHYSPMWVYLCVACGAGAAIAYVVTSKFYWEYVLVTLVHCAFLVLSHAKEQCGPFSVLAILDVRLPHDEHSLRL